MKSTGFTAARSRLSGQTSIRELMGRMFAARGGTGCGVHKGPEARAPVWVPRGQQVPPPWIGPAQGL